MLAVCRSKHEGKLRADFQQFYGLDLDGMGVDFSLIHAAFLCAELPKESRVMRELNPELQWGYDLQMLSLIEQNIRVLIWKDSKDAKHKKNYPKLIEPFKQKTKENTKAVSIEELNRVLNIKG